MQHIASTTSAQNYLNGPENIFLNIYKNIYRYISLNDEQNGGFFMQNPWHLVQVFKGVIKITSFLICKFLKYGNTFLHSLEFLLASKGTIFVSITRNKHLILAGIE